MLSDSQGKWLFADPPNVAVFTSQSVVTGADWIRYVSHDEDDGAWQFHPSKPSSQAEEPTLVALRSIVQLDPTVQELHDLPIGWQAWRPSQGEKWQRGKIQS
jgi:hypothetical protein